MKHLLVTNDFPPKLGGIQSYLWELWRRLPPESFTVLTTPYEGADAFDADLPPAETPVPDGCGPCHRCLDACPTGALVAPGVLDARRCLAWLVQAPGDFPEDLREALGDRIYGCDDCQDVCPVNRRSAADGVLPAEADVEDRVDLLALLDADDDALLAAHGRWYVPQRDPRYLRRNALVALGNTATPDDARAHRA